MRLQGMCLSIVQMNVSIDDPGNMMTITKMRRQYQGLVHLSSDDDDSPEVGDHLVQERKVTHGQSVGRERDRDDATGYSSVERDDVWLDRS